MAVTRLQRKTRKNRARAVNRKAKMKLLTQKPTIKRVDVEAIKRDFAERKNKNTEQKEASNDKKAE